MNANDHPVAAFDRLTVRYGRATALDDVTLTVAPGTVHALLGRNGAGKSSAVRCLLGTQRPNGGRALLFGSDSWTSRAHAMLRVGVVPEEPDAPPAMTPRALARFCGRLYPRWDERAVAARLARLGSAANVPFGRLSKGQKASVQLTLALGHAPELLVLDDPTLGLDVVARRELFEEMVVELADRGTTVLLTTHDLESVERIATHVGILRGGRLVLDESLETLKSRFRALRFRDVAAESPRMNALDPVRVTSRAWGVEAVVANFDPTAFARVRATSRAAEASATDAEVVPMSLEDIFVAVTEPRGGNA